MLSDPQATLLRTTYAAQVAEVRARVLAFAEQQWRGLGSWRDADVQRLLGVVLPAVRAGQRTTSSLTDAYLQQVLRIIGSRPTSGALSSSELEMIRGIDQSVVYERPFVTTWTDLSNGNTLDGSLAAGLLRLLQLASTDMQLAKTHTAQRSLSGSNDIAGYRRVLNGLRSCGLCIVASTQLYHKADLLPIHPACDCSVEPLRESDLDLFDQTSTSLLEATHAEIQARLGVSDRGARAPDYRKQLITHQHGEMGPTLSVRGQRFTSEHDLTGYDRLPVPAH